MFEVSLEVLLYAHTLLCRIDTYKHRLHSSCNFYLLTIPCEKLKWKLWQMLDAWKQSQLVEQTAPIISLTLRFVFVDCDFGSALQCLVTCGKGYKHRQTWCQFGEDRLDDRLCGSAKPESVQTCQQQECASWQVGPWGQVSVARPLHKLAGFAQQLVGVFSNAGG